MFGRKDKSKTAAAAAAASPAADAGAAGELVQESHQTGDHSQQLPQAMQDTFPQQQQEQQHVLQLVSQQLQELTSKLCPDSCQAGQPAHSGSSHAGGLGAEADAGASSSQIPDAGSSQLQGGALLQVQELQQYYEAIPEVCRSCWLRGCLLEAACSCQGVVVVLFGHVSNQRSPPVHIAVQAGTDRNSVCSLSA